MIHGGLRQTLCILTLAATWSVSADEAKLWLQIASKPQQPLTVGVASFSERAELLRQRLRLIEQYLTLYPGGSQYSECISLELETRYQLGLLQRGDLSGLCKRVSELLAIQQPTRIEEEASYWQMICTERQPTSAVETHFPEFNSSRSSASEAYIRKYPKSRHSKRLLNVIFHTAVRKSQWQEAQRIIELARATFPDSDNTLRLSARLKRHKVVGQRFPHAEGAPPEHQAIFRQVANHPHLIVVWAGFSEPASATVREIESWRKTRRSVKIVGVNLDADRAQLNAATARMNIKWPQIHDGRGWATWFAVHWDIREIPTVFAVDQQGRLLGVASGEKWRPLAERLSR